MPYSKFTKKVKGKKKYCTRHKTKGTVVCYSSKAKRKTGIKMRHAFDSGWRPTGKAKKKRKKK